MRGVVKGAGLALGVLLGSLAVQGCADPEGELEAFAKRCQDQLGQGDFDGGTTCDPVKSACEASCESPAAGLIDGQFYFVLSPSVAGDLPLVFLTDVTTQDTDGTLHVTWVMQPLSTVDGSTPVGDPLTVGPMPVVEGGLSYQVAALDVAPEANPISGGAIRAETLDILSCPPASPGGAGGVCEVTDFYCGTIPAGAVVDPTRLDIGGSTWTMRRVTGPQDYPERLTINCEGKLVDRPGPPD